MNEDKTLSYRISKINMWLFSIGKGTSVIGTAFYTFAIGLYVLKLTGSGESFALTLVMGTLPVIVISPIAGVWIDRLPKKKVAIAMDVISGILMVSLFGLSTLFGLSLWMIYMFTLLLNAATVIFSLAFEVAKPMLVLKESIVKLNSISKMIDGIANVVAPLMAGVLILWFDINLFILINGITFLGSSVMTVLMVFHQDVHVVDKQQSFRQLFTGGISYIKASKKIFGILLLLTLLNFTLGFATEVPLPYLFIQVFKLSPSLYGFIMSGFPVGIILGAMLADKAMRRASVWQLIKRMNILLSVLILLTALPLFISFSKGLSFFYFILMLGIGIAISLIDVPIMVYMQTEVPTEVRARVLSVAMSIVKLVLPFGLLLSGLLIERMPIVYIIIMGAGITATTAFCMRNM
jgi:MFS family permease